MGKQIPQKMFVLIVRNNFVYLLRQIRKMHRVLDMHSGMSRWSSTFWTSFRRRFFLGMRHLLENIGLRNFKDSTNVAINYFVRCHSSLSKTFNNFSFVERLILFSCSQIGFLEPLD